MLSDCLKIRKNTEIKNRKTDLQLISKLNKGFCFSLCTADICRKYTWIVPLKDKKGITVTSQQVLQ